MPIFRSFTLREASDSSILWEINEIAFHHTLSLFHQSLPILNQTNFFSQELHLAFTIYVMLAYYATSSLVVIVRNSIMISS